MSAAPELFAVGRERKSLHIRLEHDALDGTYSYRLAVTVLDTGGRVMASRTEGFQEGTLDLIGDVCHDVADGFLWAHHPDACCHRLRIAAERGRRRPTHQPPAF